MALTLVNDSAIISTTEYSLPSDSTVRVAQTDECTLQVYIDFSNMVAGDEYVIKFYEKYDAAGTQRLVDQWTLVNIQSRPMWVSPKFIVGAGWDFTVTRIAGADRTILWSLRKITESTSSGGGDTKEDIYTYFTSLSRQDAFKADVSSLATAAALATVDTVADLILVDTGNIANGVYNVSLAVADVPTVAEFNARTLPSADYVVVTDTIARVTLVDTVTTNSDMRGTDNAALASVATELRLANLDAAVSTRSTLDAAGVRTAVGLAAANMDTQLSGISSAVAVVDGIVDSILVDTGTTLDAAIAVIDANVDAILVDTGTTLDALIKDVPTVAEFNARTLLSADYLVASDVVTALNATYIPVDVKKINNVTVAGVGTELEPWGPEVAP